MPSQRMRVLVAGGIGVLVAVAAAWFVPWQLTVLVGWDATAVVYLVWVWASVARLDAEETSHLALAEDNDRQGARILLVGAALASLVGAAFALVWTKDHTGGLVPVVTVAAVATVLLSWALVHTQFALRYAHLYYADGAGGIDFKTDDQDPDFLDFAYVAFTVGMTFQVSDTDIQLRSIRRAILRHALLAYVFGTVIIAVTINVLAGFVR